MNFAPVFLLAVSLLASSLFAQDKSRNRIVIQPGGTPAPEAALIQTNGALPGEATLDAAVIKTIQDFFDGLKKGDVEAAYEQLTKNTKIADKPEDVTTLRTKTEQAIKMFGEIRGAERITVNTVGTHLLSATYLSLGRDLPLRWRFYFYKGGDAWRLIDLRVDDRLMDLFGEVAPSADARPTNWPKQ